MSRYNRCGDCYNMKCIFVTGERTDFDSSECADFRSMTNADRIRQMSDEELAEWYGTHACCMAEPLVCRKPGGSCRKCWLDWLKQEVDNS